MRYFQHKGRKRIFRGRLQKFDDLPLEKQENFKKIKEILVGNLGALSVFVFGSYFHGFWDEESDYDIIVYSENKLVIELSIFKDTELKINVFIKNNVDGLIPIK